MFLNIALASYLYKLENIIVMKLKDHYLTGGDVYEY